MLLFDHNATSPLCPAAREAWLDAADRFPGNPSSPHRLGARASHAVEGARERLAALLGCAGHELIFTSGATEAANTVFRQFEGEVWVSAIEHPCVLASVPAAKRIPVLPEAVTDLEWLERELRVRPPALVAVMAANNETGVLQPWREILALCRAAGVPYFCDAAQWIGKLPAGGLGDCDFVSGCAHKFGGPQGVGFLKCPPALRPLLTGGPQEEGRRAGTENVAGILAMLAALESREREAPAARQQWRDDFIATLGAPILGETRPRLWNTVSALLPDPQDRFRWVVKLDKAGVAASTGSACSSGKEEPSHVLAAMGLTPAENARVVRFSSGWETTEADWKTLLKAVRAVGRETQ